MDQQTRELINTARFNKNFLKGNSVIVNIHGDSYPMQISGIGNKNVRLSLFLPYENIIKYKNNRRLEAMIYRKINTVYHSKKRGNVWRVSG